ncbi:MAG: hypothetical protein ACK2UO_19970 [Caldilineaceae bacterium]
MALRRCIACTFVVSMLWLAGSPSLSAQESLTTDSTPGTAGIDTVEPESEPSSPLDHLWIDMALGAPIVGWYDQWARPADIARVENMAEIGLLYDITDTQKLVIFKSASDAEKHVPQLAGLIDIIGYNLEMGPENPADEQADPIAGLRRMRALADEYGLALAFGPDHDVAVNYGAEAAPYVDYFVLQIQRVQTDPEQVKDFVLPMAAALRKANPDVQISVQVRTEGDVDAITGLLTELEPQLDGISILTSRQTLDTAFDLVSALRPSQAMPALPSPDVSAPGAPVGGAPAGDATSTGLFRMGIVAGSLTTLLGLGALAIAAISVSMWILVLSHLHRSRQRNQQ